jgi:hypothetical protein
LANLEAAAVFSLPIKYGDEKIDNAPPSTLGGLLGHTSVLFPKCGLTDLFLKDDAMVAPMALCFYCIKYGSLNGKDIIYYIGIEKETKKCAK